MKRGILCVFLLTAILGHAFAQQVELPEPRFNGIIGKNSVTPAQAQESMPIAGKAQSDAGGDISFFWDRNPLDSSGLSLTPIAVLAAAGDTDVPMIPMEIRNNQYFKESTRLQELAKKSFDEGDYDASAGYAADAIRFARLSDEFVALRLKMREADLTIASAKDRIAWASSRGVDKTYPNQFNEAQGYYDEAVDSRKNEDWDSAIAYARRVLFVLADSTERLPLPAQYTVRTWTVERDCLWNIAGYSWAYADPFQWKRLYEANKARLPQPNNPNLIHPGTILSIPSIRGERREGVWQAGRSYTPLPPR